MRTVRPLRLLLLAFVAATFVVPGCGGASSSTSPTPTASPLASGIRGVMTWEGGAGAPTPVSYAGARIEVHRGGKSGPVAEVVTSAADGSFSVDLPPGDYTVVPVATGDELVLTGATTVRPGDWSQVHVGFAVR